MKTETPVTGTATVSEKGQITIPQALRRRLGIEPGQVLELSEERGRLVASRQRLRDPLDDVYGVLRLDGSVDDLIDELRGPAGDHRS